MYINDDGQHKIEIKLFLRFLRVLGDLTRIKHLNSKHRFIIPTEYWDLKGI